MRSSIKLSFGLLPLLLACSPAKSVGLDDYVANIPFEGESMKVIQLADTHWTFGSDLEEEAAYLSALINEAGADIAILTGDQILGGNKRIYTRLLDTLEESSLSYFALAWGNHDEQGLYDPDFPTNLALSYDKCLNIDHPNDDIFGRSNFVIDLTKDGKIVHELYVLDSNKLDPHGFSLAYDVIHEDQIEWYEKMVNRAKGINGAIVHSSAFFHIALWQYEYAYRLANEGIKGYSSDPSHPGGIIDYSGEMHEEIWEIPGLGQTRTYAGYEDSGFFAKAEELGSTKAMFVGHDHKNDFCALYYGSEAKANDPIALCYGLKSGQGLTYQEGHLGANVIEISAAGTITSLKRLYLDYQEDNVYESGDFTWEDIFDAI